MSFQGSRLQVTVSIGVAALNGDVTPNALFDRADKKLYEAKNRGRNRVRG